MGRHFVVAVLVTAIVGCSQVDTAEWSEEVQLYDGRVVVVDGRATRGSSGFPTEHRGGLISWELCYRPSKAYWKSPAAYKPEVFEIVNGKLYVIVPLRDCIRCTLHDFPSFSALVYRWEGVGWKRVSLAEVPGAVEPNLLSDIWGGRSSARDARGLYTLDAKRRRDWENDPAQRAARVERFQREVRDAEKGKCPVCKGGGGVTFHGEAKVPDFEGTHDGARWCE